MKKQIERKMQIIQKVEKNEDGSWSGTWLLEPEQMAFLVDYAIKDLMTKGLVTVEKQDG